MPIFRHAKLLSKTVLTAASVAVLALSAPEAEAKEKKIGFATAGQTGAYYPIGSAICNFVGLNVGEHGILCDVEATSGSIYNLNTLRTNGVDLAFAQSDWQYSAYLGEGVFKKSGPDKNLRSLFSLHNEALTIVAGKDSGINSLDDLKGKRFNMGEPGSGTRATFEELLRAKDWDESTFKIVDAASPIESPGKLCDNKIDAFAFNSGHPNSLIPQAYATCQAKIVPVQGEAVQQLVEKYPYYAAATIPGGMYVGTDEDIATYGVLATVVSSSEVDDDIIYNVVKSIFENLEAFKSAHPILANLNKERMITDGLTAPLHEGAKRYYREIGLLSDDE